MEILKRAEATIRRLQTSNRQGIVTGIVNDPYDKYGRLVKVSRKASDDPRDTLPQEVTLFTNAGQLELAEIRQIGQEVSWTLLGYPHLIDTKGERK